MRFMKKFDALQDLLKRDSFISKRRLQKLAAKTLLTQLYPNKVVATALHHTKSQKKKFITRLSYHLYRHFYFIVLNKKF